MCHCLLASSVFVEFARALLASKQWHKRTLLIDDGKTTKTTRYTFQLQEYQDTAMEANTRRLATAHSTIPLPSRCIVSRLIARSKEKWEADGAIPSCPLRAAIAPTTTAADSPTDGSPR